MRSMLHHSFFFKRLIAGILALGFILLLNPLSVFAKSEDLPLFDSLNDWLYRGAQPTEAGIKELKQKGIHTVINFRNEDKWIKWEKEQVEKSGMKYVSLPWSITSSVKPELLDQFFETLDKPENRPVFFHCKHGRDRTGVMSTLAFMRYGNLSEKEARETALKTIRPNLRYSFFVNRKISFFIKKRPKDFSQVSDG